MSKFKPLTASALLLGAVLVTGSIAIAQEGGSGTPAPGTGDQRGGMMMQGRGMGMGMMNGGDPAQMNRMMENCNRMMEAMMRQQPANPAPNTQPAPRNNG